MNRFVDGIKHFGEGMVVATELARETTPLIDERFLAIGRRAISGSDNPFFGIIEESQLQGDQRPESVRHSLTLLQPNALNTTEVDERLGLVDLMLGEQATELTAAFHDYATEHSIFERMKSTPTKQGEKFVVVSNHLELPDQGFTLGLWQKAGREAGFDRLEHHLTVVVGRLIGYYQLGDANVVDDILRKAGSVLKTFPAGGSESMTEDEQALSLFRKICNHRTKDAFGELIESREGRIICMAPSGEQDHLDRKRGVVTMRRFGGGTSEMMIDASQQGATIIPIFVDYAPDGSVAKLLDPIGPGALTNRQDCDEIGTQIASAGSYARGAAYAQNPRIQRFHSAIEYDTD